MHKDIMSLVMDEGSRQEAQSGRPMLSRSGMFYQGWKGLLLVVSFVSVFFYAYASAFQIQIEPWFEEADPASVVIHATF